MSTIQELLRELCPNGVEHRTLGECCTYLSKEALPQKELIEAGQYPVVNSSRNIYGRFNRYNNDANAVIVASHGEYAGFVSQLSGQFWAGALCHPISPKDSTTLHFRYLFHSLKFLEPKIVATLVARGSIPVINKSVMMQFAIPLPPLPVQEEIVRRLDAMQDVVEALENELALRRKQYEAVRERLIDGAAAGAECKTLGDIATSISRGSGITRDQVFDDGIPCVRYGEIYTSYGPCFKNCISHTKKECVATPKYFSHGDILFAITGEKVEDIAKSTAYLGFDSCLAGGDIVVMKHNQNPVYLGHVLCSPRVLAQKRRGKVKSKVVHSSVPEIQRIQIPVPPLPVQEEIAKKLDAFDELVNVALPTEIAARRRAMEAVRERCFAALEAAE